MVSLIANGKAAGRATPETEERVEQAIRDLDYRVNTTASALARGDLNTVAFVSPDPTTPFFSAVIEGILDELDDTFALTVLVPKTGDDYEVSALRRALAGDLAGLILASPGRTLLDGVAPSCPTVVLDSGRSRDGITSIDLDLDSAATDVAAHLTALGHRRLAYIGIDRDKASLHMRRDALELALGSRGAAFAVDDLLVSRTTIADAATAFAGVWDAWRAAGVTAVVCGDDLLAYGVLQVAQEQAIAVPAEVSVLGFNDLPYSKLVSPALTTVDLSARELGTRAAAALGALMSGRSQQSAGSSETLDTRLIVRESTGSARSL
jgi:DNA-binding LacI/PurR family transcriptional regulator